MGECVNRCEVRKKRARGEVYQRINSYVNLMALINSASLKGRNNGRDRKERTTIYFK